LKNRSPLKYQFGWTSIQRKADRAGNQEVTPKEETTVTETIEELEKRRDLLKEINALIPDEETMAALAAYVENIRGLEGLEQPTEDDMKAVADHLSILKEIENTEAPSDEEMKAIADHLATLKEIENAA
jgi:hypothetical protein